MLKHSAKNERIKRLYLAWLEEAKGLATTSADQAAAALSQFEETTNYRDFSAFNIEQARRFKRILAEQTNKETGKPLAKATVRSRLMALRAFFQWLPSQPGYRILRVSDADYFNPSANDSRVATARRERPVPSIEQIEYVIASIEPATDIDRRDRAVIAFTLVSGARDSAIASLLMRHVDVERRTVFQDARTVRTKNRKTFESWFFPASELAERIVVEWVRYLGDQRLFGHDDPLFPATLVRPAGEQLLFRPVGLSRQPWSDSGPIRRIFHQRFKAAGLPYFHPHSFRSTLTLLGEKICNTEEFKAWSQNLGHEHVGTTFANYGKVASHRQGEIFEQLRHRSARPLAAGDPDAKTVAWVMDYLRRKVAA